ncbi:hypothetical protein Cyrtocomes_00824 [Candidatus Cyrtobacter comes]|uniref:Uncharacterized protein n=1 Tax=Candidatus Cyrtobacter comes TaxID=675776 RepID=A0ABU5L8J2_9RICK|nr:hypothetical protein [Candidatus Cyrtobacter comes]MDZ5762441.1 hypothetical protein [Candidatus Cyrtobacter comes]
MLLQVATTYNNMTPEEKKNLCSSIVFDLDHERDLLAQPSNSGRRDSKGGSRDSSRGASRY